MAALISEPIAVTGNLFTVRGDTETHEKFLLGIINSKVTEFFWKVMFTDFKSTFPQVTIFSLSQVPIPFIDPKSKSDRAVHDALVAQVERMLKLHEQLAAAKSPDAQTHLQRDIAATDRALDQLVYTLYDLTPEEIALVEQSPTARLKPDIYTPVAGGGYYESHFLAKEDPPET